MSEEPVVNPEEGMPSEEAKKTFTEEFKVKGDQLLGKVREIVHAGNVRRIVIKDEEGRRLIDIPLTVGVIGAVLAPVWAAIGAVAALVTDCTIEVEKTEDHGPEV